MPCPSACDLLQSLPHVKSCCCFLRLRTGCILVGWWVLGEGFLVMCGYLELEGEEEKRRSNFTNGSVGASLFLLGIFVIGGVTEAKPLWLDSAALMILACSVGLVVNSVITFIRRDGNLTLYLMSVLLVVVLYCDVVLLGYAAELRDQERREREESARLSPLSMRRATSLSAEATPRETLN